MSNWQLQPSRFFRLPKAILDVHRLNPLLGDLMVASCGHRNGDIKSIGYYVQKRPSTEYLLKYCTAGEGWLEVDHTRYEIKAGDLLLLNNARAHRYGANKENPWTVSWAYFEGTLGAYYYDLLMGTSKTPVIAYGHDPKLDALFLEILSIMDKGYAQQYHLHISNLFKTLMSTLHLNMQAGANHTAFQLEDSIRYMLQNLHQSLTLDELAKPFPLSKDHFTKLFKQQYGFTPIDYFIHMKMQKACELMGTTDFSLIYIAQQVGFVDYYYFSRLFKNKIGMSPKTYRERFKP